ncbi:unnamed protein product [Vicia faba]|uniref:Reverse transcriptase domain-containing protein n=1 Tax=Vicia faba TaxID=3906 RepID=A0AAV0ZYC5_VICFA|nr:unnamed protein product [Vicia faba]
MVSGRLKQEHIMCCEETFTGAEVREALFQKGVSVKGTLFLLTYLFCVFRLTQERNGGQEDSWYYSCSWSSRDIALVFTNDILLFARANTNEATKILDILRQYHTASGQIVNLVKSEASFSGNVRNEDRAEIQSLMGVNDVQGHSRYLGVPNIFRRSKKKIHLDWWLIECGKKLKAGKRIFYRKLGKRFL